MAIARAGDNLQYNITRLSERVLLTLLNVDLHTDWKLGLANGLEKNFKTWNHGTLLYGVFKSDYCSIFQPIFTKLYF